jgi:hypothetical protein
VVDCCEHGVEILVSIGMEKGGFLDGEQLISQEHLDSMNFDIIGFHYMDKFLK